MELSPQKSPKDTILHLLFILAFQLLLIQRVAAARGLTDDPAHHRALQSTGPDLDLSALPWTHPEDAPAPAYHAFINEPVALISHQLGAETSGVLSLYVVSGLEYHEGNLLGLVNSLTSLILLGKQERYIVAAIRPDSLAVCLRMRLPCLNATQHRHVEYPPVYATWAKVLVARDVLRAMPPHAVLHVTDYDVVYLKRVPPSVTAFFATAARGAVDVSMMREEGPQYDARGPRGGNLTGAYVVNTGVLFARNTPSTHALYDAWAGAVTKEMHDQDKLVHLHLRSWAACATPAACAAVAAHPGRVAAVARHNEPAYRPGLGLPQCPPCEWAEPVRHDAEGQRVSRCPYDRDHCSIRERLYFHAICDGSKTELLKGLGAWFVRNDRAAQLPVVSPDAIRAAGLPCTPPLDVAQLRHVP